MDVDDERDEQTRLLAYRAIYENTRQFRKGRRICEWVFEMETRGSDTICPSNEYFMEKFNWSRETVQVAISEAKRSQIITTTGRGKYRTFELNVQFLKGKMAEITARVPLRRGAVLETLAEVVPPTWEGKEMGKVLGKEMGKVLGKEMGKVLGKKNGQNNRGENAPNNNSNNKKNNNNKNNTYIVSYETMDIPSEKSVKKEKIGLGSASLEGPSQSMVKSEVDDKMPKQVDDEPTPQVPATPLPSKKVRVVDENGEVRGGHPYTERAYELWNEIMGQPCKRNQWNGRAGWNMMRAKDKGEEWLRGMIILARECKKDPKADFRASHVANLADLQKNREYVLDWYRKKKLEKDTAADKGLDFLRGKR